MTQTPMPMPNSGAPAPEPQPSRGGGSGRSSEGGFDRALNEASDRAADKGSGSRASEPQQAEGPQSQGQGSEGASGQQADSGKGKDGQGKPGRSAGQGPEGQTEGPKGRDGKNAKDASGESGTEAASKEASPRELLERLTASLRPADPGKQTGKGEAAGSGKSGNDTSADTRGKGASEKGQTLAAALRGAGGNGKAGAEGGQGAGSVSGQGGRSTEASFRQAVARSLGLGDGAARGDGRHAGPGEASPDEAGARDGKGRTEGRGLKESEKGPISSLLRPAGANGDRTPAYARGATRVSLAAQGDQQQNLSRALGNGEGVAVRAGSAQQGGAEARSFDAALQGRGAIGGEAQGQADTGWSQAGSATGRTEGSASLRQGQAQQPVNRAMVQVAQDAAGGKRDVKIKLHPPHLGQMRVELQVTDNKVQAVFHMDSRAAAGAVDGQMHALRQALQAQEMDLENVEVHVRDDGQPGQDGQAGENQARDQGEGRSGGQNGGRPGGGPSGDDEDGGGETIVSVPGPGDLSLYA